MMGERNREIHYKIRQFKAKLQTIYETIPLNHKSSCTLNWTLERPEYKHLLISLKVICEMESNQILVLWIALATDFDFQLLDWSLANNFWTMCTYWFWVNFEIFLFPDLHKPLCTFSGNLCKCSKYAHPKAYISNSAFICSLMSKQYVESAFSWEHF